MQQSSGDSVLTDGQSDPDGTKAQDGSQQPDLWPQHNEAGTKADGSPSPDSGAASSGQVIITEFMANPAAVSDTNGEYVELYNPGTKAIDLKGWTLKDDGTSGHVISKSLVINPKSYLVLGRNDVSSQNGGVNVAYEFTSFSLTNSGDEIVLLDTTKKQVDRVAYTGDWFVFSGYSNMVKSTTLDNSKAENWCFAGGPWKGTMGDYGSPGGAANCAPMVPSGCTHKTKKTINYSSHLCAPLLAGWKKITIRNGHLTSPSVGDWVRLFCTGANLAFEAKITVVRHTTYGGITQTEYQDDGFSTQAQMLAALKKYYPGITLASDATIIRWVDTTYCD